MSQEKIRRLGRGLDALLPTVAVPIGEGKGVARAETAFRTVPVSLIVANPNQPRKEFDPVGLEDLRKSIQSSGLLQPLLVRPKGAGFELVAGERRFRAIQALGWRDVPVHVRELDDQAMLTLALIENLQRSDLNPIEEAEGYQELVARFTLTQQQVADSVGRERSTVANMLRLLALPAVVRNMVRDGSLSLGHARALLGFSDLDRMVALATIVVTDGLTVREVERRVREAGTKPALRRKTKQASTAVATPEVKGIEDQLRRHFQTDVAMSLTAADRGEVRLAFYSTDDLERLLDLMLGSHREIV